jgi:hypothetical protein
MIQGFITLRVPISYRGLPMPDCPICANPQNLDVVNLVLSGKITISDAMHRLGIEDRAIFEKHIKEHIRVATGSGDEICAVEKKTLDGVGVLTTLANRMNKVAMNLLDKLDEMEDFDLSLIGPMTNLSKEIRSSAKVIAELNGDIETRYVVELRIQQNTISQLQNFIMSNLCDEDKKKVMAFLGKELGVQ